LLMQKKRPVGFFIMDFKRFVFHPKLSLTSLVV